MATAPLCLMGPTSWWIGSVIDFLNMKWVRVEILQMRNMLVRLIHYWVV